MGTNCTWNTDGGWLAVTSNFTTVGPLAALMSSRASLRGCLCLRAPLHVCEEATKAGSLQVVAASTAPMHRDLPPKLAATGTLPPGDGSNVCICVSIRVSPRRAPSLAAARPRREPLEPPAKHGRQRRRAPGSAADDAAQARLSATLRRHRWPGAGHWPRRRRRSHPPCLGRLGCRPLLRGERASILPGSSPPPLPSSDRRRGARPVPGPGVHGISTSPEAGPAPRRGRGLLHRLKGLTSPSPTRSASCGGSSIFPSWPRWRPSPRAAVALAS